MFSRKNIEAWYEFLFQENTFQNYRFKYNFIKYIGKTHVLSNGMEIKRTILGKIKLVELGILSYKRNFMGTFTLLFN